MCTGLSKYLLSFAIILIGAAMLAVAIALWHRPAVVWLGLDQSVLLLDLSMLAVVVAAFLWPPSPDR
jgi:hypothetical protein